MVTPTWVVTAHGAVWDVKVTSGLATTPQDTVVPRLVVLVEGVVPVAAVGGLEPLGGAADELQAASRPPAMTARSHPRAFPTPQVSHCVRRLPLLVSRGVRSGTARWRVSTVKAVLVRA